MSLDALALDGLRTDSTSYFAVLPAELVRLLPHYWAQELAAYKFNTDKPNKAIAWMIAQGLITDEVGSLAAFLSENEPRLDPMRLGELIGDRKRKEMLKSYANSKAMAGLPIDEALRGFFAHFRLPGEAQMIDGIMEVFAERYVAENRDHPEVKSPDTAYMVAFAIAMLSTDLWSPTIKNKMAKDQFERSMRGMGLSVAFLHSLYDSYVSTRHHLFSSLLFSILCIQTSVRLSHTTLEVAPLKKELRV